MIDQDLLAYLQALNTLAEGRVFLESVEGSAPRPCIVVRRAGGSQPRTLNGVALFERSQFEINVLTGEHATAYPITNQITQALHGFRGMLGATHVHDARCVLFPDHTSEVDGDLITRWVTSQFSFMHSEG